MFRKQTALILFLLFILTACAPEAALPTKPTSTLRPTMGDVPSIGEDGVFSGVLTISASEFVPDQLFQYIDAFTVLHPDVTIKVNRPSGSYTDQATALSASLMGGGGDDLIETGIIPYEAYARRGMFEDLYGYMDKEMREDYYPKVLESMTVGGGLYALPKTFAFPSYWLKGSECDARVNELLSEQTTLNYRDVIKVFDEVRKTAPQLRYPGSYFNVELLKNAELPLFYNYATGYVDFGTAFVSMAKEIAPYAIDPTQLPSEDECLFRMFLGISGMNLVPFLLPSTQNNRAWGVVDCNGNPVIWQPVDVYAVNANSPNKELAWEFLKFYSSNEAFFSTADFAIPVRKSILYGAALENVVRFEFSTSELARESADYVNNLLEHDFVRFSDPDPFLTELMNSAFRDYNTGLLTAEQLAARLQEKLTLYVNQ